MPGPARRRRDPQVARRDADAASLRHLERWRVNIVGRKTIFENLDVVLGLAHADWRRLFDAPDQRPGGEIGDLLFGWVLDFRALLVLVHQVIVFPDAYPFHVAIFRQTDCSAAGLQNHPPLTRRRVTKYLGLDPALCRFGCP